MADADHKRMLEMAAKAMGWTQAEFQDMRGWGEVRHGFSEAMWVPEMGEYWNPLASDGDCARMEAALGIHVAWHSDGVVCGKRWAGSTEMFSDHAGDRNAARRMASLRVAAAIGEKMP